MTNVGILVLAFSFPAMAFANVNEAVCSKFSLEKQGSEVCRMNAANEKGKCFQTLRSVGVEISEPVEHLYPQISSFAEWNESSPASWPTTEKDLKIVGGAILLEPAQVHAVTSQLTQLDVRNLSTVLSSSGQRTTELPFALSIDWKDRENHTGTLEVIGKLDVADTLLDLNLGDTDEFRDRFVKALHIQELSGAPIPLKLGPSGDPTNEALRQIVAPMLAGKWVSVTLNAYYQAQAKVEQTRQDRL